MCWRTLIPTGWLTRATAVAKAIIFSCEDVKFTCVPF